MIILLWTLVLGALSQGINEAEQQQQQRSSELASNQQALSRRSYNQYQYAMMKIFKYGYNKGKAKGYLLGRAAGFRTGYRRGSAAGYRRGNAAGYKRAFGCPKSHPYAYLNGSWCCKYNREKYYSKAPGNTCDRSIISRTSTCCQGDAYTKCPHGQGRGLHGAGGKCYNYSAK